MPVNTKTSFHKGIFATASVNQYHVGVAQFRKGNLDAALEAFRAAVEINPEDRKSRENLKALEEMRARFS